MSTSSPERRTALVVGVLFVITFLVSIPAVLLYEPLLKHADYILGSGADTRVTLGAFLEVILAIANIGTAVALYPVFKRRHPSLSLGYVASRVLESTIIVVGIVSVLSVVTLRKQFAGGVVDPSLATTGRSLVAVHDWTFLLGPGYCAGIGTGMLLGYMMYRSGLVPRRMALLGLVGGPLIFASSTAIMFGAYKNGGSVAFLMALPEILWEASLGIYLIAKGFKSSSILSDNTRHNAVGGPLIPVVAP
jgi:hypothetical protein